MFYFVQYKPNKKERWQLHALTQDYKSAPAFQTVLQVSADPDCISDETEAREQIKYFGPMYFDLDGTDINAVLKDGVDLLNALEEEWGADPKFFSIYLSGKKGIHITIPPELFGIKSARAYLPLIWGKFAERFPQESIDRGVYSMGKGRMWRCTGVKRPDNDAYKIQITASELRSMTADKYHEMVKAPRPDLHIEKPELAPQLSAVVPILTTDVRKDEKLKKKAAENNINDADIRLIQGIPGCIQILITEGDDPSSNWNQAAMQLAGYIGARYRKEETDDYMNGLVEPFVDNVESSGRPDRKDRLKAVKELVHKAFSGRVKFSFGGLYNATKQKCNNCELCRPNIKETTVEEGNDAEYYDQYTKLKFTKTQIVLVGENSSRPICNFGLRQDTAFLEPDMFQQLRTTSGYYILTNQQGIEFQVELPESVFTDKRSIHQYLTGTGGIFSGSDADLQSLGMSLVNLRHGVDEMIRTRTAGIVFHESKGEVYPQLVTLKSAFAKGGLPSKYTYIGPTRIAPSFDQTPDFMSREEVTEAIKGLRALTAMNDLDVMLPAIGWMMAAQLKTHLTYGQDPTFPMLSVSGTSESGKSSTMFLLLALNGFPYRQVPFWNAELDTMYPLEEMVSTSTTFVRMVEEANEHNAKRNWSRLIGILKSSWDGGDIMKGGLQGRNVVTTAIPNKAPVCYVSEQAFPVQSIRTRSIECHFSSRAMANKEYEANFAIAEDRHKYLEMFAKVLATTALNTPVSSTQRWMEEALGLLPTDYRGRTRRAYSVVMVGLKFLSYVMETYDEAFAAEILEMRDQLIAELSGKSKELVKAKRHSALDDIIQAFDTMAAESDNPHHGLVVGTHYWVVGKVLYLDLRQSFPRFRRYARGIGMDLSVSSAAQVKSLIVGETYYEGSTQHPYRAQVEILMLNMDTLRDKGTVLTNFEIGDATP